MATNIVTETVKKTVSDILKDFVGSFGADALSQHVWHRPRAASVADQAYMGQVTQLFREGKFDEASKMLQAQPGGFGMADEMILLTDLLALERGRLVHRNKRTNHRKVADLVSFLGNLEPNERRKFRLAHTQEKDADVRRANLVALANLPSNDERMAAISVSGTLDPDAIDGINAMDDAAGRSLRAIDRDNYRMLREWRRRHPAGRRTPTTLWEKFLDLFDFNPLR